jgi:hypothetical protein
VRASGSCRDSAWLLVQALRHLGFAARFVSGYLIQLVADQKPLDGPVGPTADFTDLHAWAEVYLPGAGWVGLDPTSGLMAGEGHIPLAATPEPASAAPITGLVDEGRCRIRLPHASHAHRRGRRASPSPIRMRPGPRSRRSATAWMRRWPARTMRLTMGGEPTFVAERPRRAGMEHGCAGPHQARLCRPAAAPAASRSGPGGASDTGQGKWYPGEPLPRFALSAHWRARWGAGLDAPRELLASR